MSSNMVVRSAVGAVVVTAGTPFSPCRCLNVTTAGAAHTPGTLAKVALRWKAGDCALSINGGAVVTSAPAAVPTGITTLRLGQLADGTLPQFGTDALLAAWSTGLSNGARPDRPQHLTDQHAL